MTVTAPDSATYSDESHASFGPFLLYPDGRLFRELVEVHLPPKELAILRVLIARAGEIVAPKELRRSAWGDVHVSDDSLPRCVSSLRAHLESQECIQTVYKRGYRFRLPVEKTSPTLQVGGFVARRDGDRRKARPAGPLRLAIMPFATGDGVPPSLGSGIAEETMLRLARARNPVAHLIARDSVFHLAALGVSAREVGATLVADLVLAGAVTALPVQFRLRIEMIRVGDGVQLWVEDFVVPREQLSYSDARAAKRITARIQASFPAAIATVGGTASVSGTVFPRVAVGIAASQESIRNEAYAVYLEACAAWNSGQRQCHPTPDAMRGFQRALELDPALLDARIRLTHGYLAQGSYGSMRPDLAAEQARKHAEIALMASPAGQALYPALGWIHLHHDRDFAAAAEALDRPHRSGYEPRSTIYRMRFALCQGRCDEAIELLRSDLEIDPYSPVLHSHLVWALHLAGDTDAAVEQALRTENLFPGHAETLLFCAIVFAAASRAGDASSELPVKAMAMASRLVQEAPSLDAGYCTLAYVQARQGCIIEAHAQLDQQRWLGRERFVLSSFQVPALVELGEFDAAVEALAAAERHHCPWLFELMIDPRLEPLRNEPEYQRLRRLTREIVTSNASVA